MDDPWIYVFLLLNGWTCTFHLTWQAQNGRMGRILTYVSCIRKGLHASWFSALKEGPSQIKSDCSKGLFRCTRAGTFYSTQHYISAWWHLWMSKKKKKNITYITYHMEATNQAVTFVSGSFMFVKKTRRIFLLLCNIESFLFSFNFHA